jgi:SAM-dependent methyltransferase
MQPMSGEADEIIGLYRRHALAWTTARGERLIERSWLERFLAAPPAAKTVLDLGCGSGAPIARFFAGHGYSVTGIDSAPEMIALFREKLPDQQAQVADMRTLDLRARFGGVLAWDSFFHLSHADQRAMFPVFRDHALPGATLMFTSGPAFGEAIGSLEGEPLYHASLDPDDYRGLLAGHGFDVIDQLSEDPDCGGRTVWLARKR